MFKMCVSFVTSIGKLKIPITAKKLTKINFNYKYFFIDVTF